MRHVSRAQLSELFDLGAASRRRREGDELVSGSSVSRISTFGRRHLWRLSNLPSRRDFGWCRGATGTWAGPERLDTASHPAERLTDLRFMSER